ncbi:hypothetical protein NIE79_004705 [Micromonospora sp. NIE79]|uniref:DUF2690 domain-containing protein n=1 Tax=Micromonospora trifolii TaxID=2911208 RepID=A0ABS9N8Y7_9ACTN|nr:hypothetical protein [Micromonospora trifolii]MCG5446140.1 hypothetical protein [Micromonospora trifolii]
MRRTFVVATALTVLALAACAESETPQTAAPSPSMTSARPSPSPTPSLTAEPTTSPPLPPSPTPAWTPCNRDLSSYEGGCQDELFGGGDSCDISYVEQQAGSLLDLYIENGHHIDAERLQDCPQFMPTWKKAATGFTDGSHEVGKEIKPGTYETTAHSAGETIGDCYWERSTDGGRTIANDFITAAKKVRVTIRSSDGIFTSRGCGNWVRV